MSGQTTEELEPLAADIADLLAAERPLEVASAEKKAHAYALVAARIATLGGPPDGGGHGGNGDVGGGPIGGAGATAKTVVASKAWTAALATFALGGVIGGGVVYAVVEARPPRVVTVEMPAPAVVAPTENATRPTPSLGVMDLPSAKAPATMPANANGPATANTNANDLARGLAAERALLDIARGGLARGAPEEALEAVSRHARDYPQGVLAEEREAIAIKALAAVGRMDDARARAARFRARYPKSLSLPAIEGVLGATSQ